jgi:hypothetical protein
VLHWVLQAKCTLGDETRLLHIGPSVSYAEMLEGVRAKFPDAPPFALKFLDRWVPFTPAMVMPATPLAYLFGVTPGAKPLSLGARPWASCQTIYVCVSDPATAHKGHRCAQLACTSIGVLQP